MTETRLVTRVVESPLVKVGVPRRLREGLRADNGFNGLRLSALWLVFLGIVPIVAAIIMGMIQGTSGEESYAPMPGYPAFPLFSPLLVIPAPYLALQFVRTFTWPLTVRSSQPRMFIVVLSMVGYVTLLCSSSLDANNLPHWAITLNAGAAFLYLVLAVLAGARVAAGALHLVPRSWREEPAKPKKGRRP